MPAVQVSRLSIAVTAGRPHHRFVPHLRRHLRAAHDILKSPLCELSLALVGDKKMAELHAQFLAIAGPTDVLTFPLELDSRGRPISGEVVVCVPEARRQCAENRNLLRDELLLYSLHGLLHLCGYNDKTDEDFKRMHRTEDDILRRIGVGPVFAHGRGVHAAMGKKE